MIRIFAVVQENHRSQETTTTEHVLSAKMLNRRVVIKRALCFTLVTTFGFIWWCTFGSNTLSSSVYILGVRNEMLNSFKQGLNRLQNTSMYLDERNSSVITNANCLGNCTVASSSCSCEQLKQHDNRNSTHAIKHKTTLITTANCLKHYFLLILVSSAPSNSKRRTDIRITWGMENSTKPRWKTRFLVAQTRDQNLSKSLMKEADSFGDLIRADYFDDYWNQTLKIQMGIEWASRYCNFSYLLKIDDDVFVDTDALLRNLSEPSMPRERLYMGLLWQKLPVRRYKGDKWEVTKEEYEPDFYPDYCPGFGFVLSVDVVDTFVSLFQVVKPFKIDDVYVGMLAERAGVNGTNNYGFREKPSPPLVPCTLDNKTIIWHGITGECLFKLYKSCASRWTPSVTS